MLNTNSNGTEMGPANSKSKQPLSIKNIILIGGAWISYCIGSGFATGQSSMQYFVTYGGYGFIAIVIGILIHMFVSGTHMTVAYDNQFDKPIEIYDYYGGKIFGKICAGLTVVYAFMGSATMISGFGATAEQTLGIAPVYGSIAMGLIGTITVLLGLKKVTDVIGSIGPILIIVTIIVGIVYFFNHKDGLQEGMAIAPQLDSIARIGDHWIQGGIFYATWAPVCCAPFLAALAKQFKNRRDLIAGAIAGNVGLGIAEVVLVLALFTNIAVISQNMVPTIYMSSVLTPVFTILFTVVIILGIYSCIVPNLYTISITFFKERTKGFIILTILMGIGTTIYTTIMPFDQLLSWTFTIYGWIGIPFLIIIIIRQIMHYSKRKKNAA